MDKIVENLNKTLISYCRKPKEFAEVFDPLLTKALQDGVVHPIGVDEWISDFAERFLEIQLEKIDR